MSDEKDTAASPDELDDELNEEATETTTEDELTEYRRLHAKVEKDKAAKAAAAQKEKDDEVAAKAEEAMERQRHHVVIRHIGRGPKTRTMRAARSGHRRQGVLLDDGTRIRKKGRQRALQVSLERLVVNHKSLLEYVRVGQIEICEPFNLEVIPYPELLGMVQDMGQWLYDKKARDKMEAYGDVVEKYNEDLGLYEEAMAEWRKAVKEAKKNDQPLPLEPIAPVEPVEPEAEEPKKFELDPGVKYPDEPVEKMPSLLEDGEPELLEDGEPSPPRPGDATIEDVDTSAVTAAVDQANAQKAGEANPPPSETGASEEEEGETDVEVLTEADLKKMTRPELDELAKANELDPAKYSKKEELVEAILSLGEE